MIVLFMLLMFIGRIDLPPLIFKIQAKIGNYFQLEFGMLFCGIFEKEIVCHVCPPGSF